MLLAWLIAAAGATEVVWLSPPPDSEIERLVAAQAGATGDALEAIDLRAAATRWTEADDEALASLDQTLRDVREFETRLDGELIIMADLAGPIDAVSLIRDDTDLAKMFSALTYQGFAVDRFFEDQLAVDERAAAYRVELGGRAVSLPWSSAAALAPDKSITAYDIAEAPQRVAYTALMKEVVGQIPGSLVPSGPVPEGATLFVDGKPAQINASGAVRVVPGRHYVHIDKDGRVLFRARPDVQPGARVDLDIGPSDDEWNSLLATLADGGAPPQSLHAAIDALGGEVWLAEAKGVAGDIEVDITKLTPAGVEPVEFELPRGPSEGDDGNASVHVWVGGAWMATHDFYYQNPVVEPTFGLVNAPTLAGGVDGELHLGPIEVGAGVDVGYSLGAGHAARFGDDSETRLRVHPRIGIGALGVQATAGFLFPHHVAFGARAAIPLVGPNGPEIRIAGTIGINAVGDPPAGSTWRGAPVYAAILGIGWRISP